MKRYIFAAAVVLLTAVSCSTETVDDTPSMLAIETVPTWDVTRGITSASQTVRVGVNLNVQTVNWSVSSDSDWCEVDRDAVYTGSGEFDMVVKANDGFDRRNAVITISAGLYSQRMEVDQAGNIFILSDVYKVLASNEEASFDIEVRTRTAWTVDAPAWISAGKVGEPVVDSDGMTTTTLHIEVGRNDGAQERYDAVRLVPEEGYSADFTVFQFGRDVLLTDDGKIDIAAEGNVAFNVTAPFGIIEKIETPYWVECSETLSEDGLSTKYRFWIGKNLSDTKAGREGVIRFDIKDSESVVTLPAVKQDFFPAGGIVTGLGFKMFAEAYNAGDDISYWSSEVDGKTVVEVLSDVNMSEVDSWTPAGTAERPFDCVFKGNGWLIKDWRGDNPLFGVTGGDAVISNIIIDSDCTVSFSGSYSSERYLGAFVGTHRGLLENCINRAGVSVKAVDAVAVTGFGGLVGNLDGGRIADCANNGNITVGGDVKSTKSFYAGGIAAYMTGDAVIEKSTFTGSISDFAVISDNSSKICIGGVAGYAAGQLVGCTTGDKSIVITTDTSRGVYCGGIAGYSEAAITNCVNSMSLSDNLLRNNDAVRYGYVGGIVGWQENGDITGCTNRGALVSSSNHKFLFAGGIGGIIIKGKSENNVNIAKIDILGNTAQSIKGARIAYVGGLFGEVRTAASVKGDGSTVTTGVISVSSMEGVTGGGMYVGGVVGCCHSTVENVVNEASVNIPSTLVYTTWGSGGRCCIGGIVGNIEFSNGEPTTASISHCNNKGSVVWLRVGSTINGAPVYAGGILGYAFPNAKVTVSDCNNSGTVSNLHYNNRYLWSDGANAGGGIVGAHDGESADALLTVISCTNTASVNVNRTNAGGIVGYVKYGVVRDCRNTGTYDSGGNDNRRNSNGGIVSEAYYTTVENCVNRAKVFAQETGGRGPRCGGIVAILGEGSSVSECRHFGEVEAKKTSLDTFAGGIVGESVVGTSISGCGFGGRVDGADVTEELICGDGNFTDGGGNYVWDGRE